MGLTWAGCGYPLLFWACSSWRLPKVRDVVVPSCGSICVFPATCERYINSSGGKPFKDLYTIMLPAVPNGCAGTVRSYYERQSNDLREKYERRSTVCVQSFILTSIHELIRSINGGLGIFARTPFPLCANFWQLCCLFALARETVCDICSLFL